MSVQIKTIKKWNDNTIQITNGSDTVSMEMLVVIVVSFVNEDTATTEIFAYALKRR